jgi:hypothetical protein
MNAVLIGLPQSGKSTLFSAVTGVLVDPFAVSDSHRAIVRVPDPRLEFLRKLHNPKKVIEATVEIVDVPGCSLDDAHGRDAWRRLLPTLRQADLFMIVVRDFENDSVPPFRGRVDGKGDFAVVWEELIFADLDTVTTRVERLEAALKKPTKTHDAEKREFEVLLRCREALEAEQPLSSVVETEDDRRQVSSFGFLTQKPLLGIRNVCDDRASIDEVWEIQNVEEVITLSASIEADIAALDEEDRPAFLSDLGLTVAARDRFIQACYRSLGLISFLTMGPDEVRAWPITKGTTAEAAAGRIHSDLARGFIRAETVAYDDLVAHEDMRGAKAAGKVRKEGKGYIVKDGDIMEILANV